MTAQNPSGETVRADAAETELILPGPLVEDMQTGLMRILGLRQTFAQVRSYQKEMIENVVDLEEVEGSLTEIQGFSEGPKAAGQLLDLLDRQSRYSIYGRHNRLGRVGYTAFLLGAEDKFIEKEQQAWAEGPVVRNWIGEAVVLRRPSESVIRQDDSWGNRGALYRILKGGEPDSRYYRGGDGHGGKDGCYGKLRLVSLEQGGRVVLSRPNQEGVEIIEMFEEIEDPETGMVTGYIPRLSVGRVTKADRATRS